MDTYKTKSCVAAGVIAFLALAYEARAESVDFGGMQTNGSASVVDGTLNLGNGSYWESSSAFLKTPFLTEGLNFTGSFDFTLQGNPTLADGISFMIQGQGPTALGAYGGSLGAAGIGSALAIGFQSAVNDHATIFTSSEGPYEGTGSAGNFSLGGQAVNAVSVFFSYVNGVFGYTAKNNSTNQQISDSRAFDLTALGPKIYFGFTGATGAWTSAQTITNFTLKTSNSVPVPGPEAGAGLGAFALGGIALYLKRQRKRDKGQLVSSRYGAGTGSCDGHD